MRFPTLENLGIIGGFIPRFLIDRFLLFQFPELELCVSLYFTLYPFSNAAVQALLTMFVSSLATGVRQSILITRSFVLPN